MLVKALSVRQPWVWAIFQAGKDVENRTWGTLYRGVLAIHASLYKPTRAECAVMKAPTELPCGVIVGTVELVDCARNESKSKWAAPDSWHWIIAKPRLLIQPIRETGQLGLWTVNIP